MALTANQVKALALAMEFHRVGIAPAAPVHHTEPLQRWLSAGSHAGMSYMDRNGDLRHNPAGLVPSARTVICLAVSYAPAEESHPQVPQGEIIARYARGRDYHKVLKKRCIRLMDAIRQVEPSFEGRAFVDSAPVMERSLAVLAGLGWIGRNGCLISPPLGSYVLLCEIVCNLALECDSPLDGSCGQCGACQRACPTGALTSDGLVDANKCISYLTIEHRGQIAPAFWPLMGTRVFGCDACQSVCPHNRQVAAGDSELVNGLGPPLSVQDIMDWDEETCGRMTQGRAIRRATWWMFLRNAVIAAGNSDDPGMQPRLARLRQRVACLPDDQTLLGLIDWAILRLGQAGGKETGRD